MPSPGSDGRTAHRHRCGGHRMLPRRAVAASRRPHPRTDQLRTSPVAIGTDDGQRLLGTRDPSAAPVHRLVRSTADTRNPVRARIGVWT